jgi:hypothetical protein
MRDEAVGLYLCVRNKICKQRLNEEVNKTMKSKSRPNHKLYIEVLRNMSPEKRLLKAFELSEFARQLFIHGLRKRFPDLEDTAFKKLLLERLDKCHNRNY